MNTELTVTDIAVHDITADGRTEIALVENHKGRCAVVTRCFRRNQIRSGCRIASPATSDRAVDEVARWTTFKNAARSFYRQTGVVAEGYTPSAHDRAELEA